MLEDLTPKFLRNPENRQNLIICFLDHDHFWKISLKSVHGYFCHIKQMAAIIFTSSPGGKVENLYWQHHVIANKTMWEQHVETQIVNLDSESEFSK